MSDSLTDAGAFLQPYMPISDLSTSRLARLSALGARECGAGRRLSGEHGARLNPGRTPLDRMVDEATGADKAFLEAFAAWMNANVWGEV